MNNEASMQVCHSNLANIYEYAFKGRSNRVTAAGHRRGLYQSLARTSGRSMPSQCSICLMDIDPAAATEGDDGELEILTCAHCYHRKCGTAHFCKLLAPVYTYVTVYRAARSIRTQYMHDTRMRLCHSESQISACKFSTSV